MYEDFLPRSAAGIFASNLDGPATTVGADGGPELDLDWIAGVIGASVHDPVDLYAAQRRASLDALAATLGRDPASLQPPTGHLEETA